MGKQERLDYAWEAIAGLLALLAVERDRRFRAEALVDGWRDCFESGFLSEGGTP